MACGVRKLAIGALAPDITNSLVIGVIIAKQNFRCYISRKDGVEKGVWSFTIRDSPMDTINITYWGSVNGARSSHDEFRVGDVVQIMNPRVLFRQPSNCDSAFTPTVTSPFQLQLYENNSLLLAHTEDDREDIRKLMFIPTKPHGDFLRLSDLLSYGQAMKGDYVNILVAIRNVGEIRSVRSKKDSRNIVCRDVMVMDQTHLEFKITLWDEHMDKANFWRPRHTVLFFADIRIDWNDFKQTVAMIITSKTIMTENPDTNEAESLRLYAKNLPIEPIAILDHLSKSIGDPLAINTVMTTAQIMDKAYNYNNLISDNKFMALIFATVTALDLDSSESPLIYKCATCSRFMGETDKCLNTECLLNNNNKYIKSVPCYNLNVNLTDHRGSLYKCRLMSPAADDVLGCPVEKYLKLSLSEKTKLKWNLLLSLCEIRVLILCTSPERAHPFISILTCRRANPKDISSRLAIY